MKKIYLAIITLLLCGCGPGTGMERGDCFPNSACNAGLECYSGLCVKVPLCGVDFICIDDQICHQGRRIFSMWKTGLVWRLTIQSVLMT